MIEGTPVNTAQTATTTTTTTAAFPAVQGKDFTYAITEADAAVLGLAAVYHESPKSAAEVALLRKHGSKTIVKYSPTP